MPYTYKYLYLHLSSLGEQHQADETNHGKKKISDKIKLSGIDLFLFNEPMNIYSILLLERSFVVVES